MYKLTAWLEWANDEQSSDDTLRLDYYVSKTILPYENNFSGAFAGIATNQMYGNISWEVDTPSVTPVFGDQSLVFRSSEAKGSISQALFSSVSLQGTYRPQMYFTYAHDNANPYSRDQMEVRISQDGGATFKTIQTLYRYDASCTVPTWKQYQIDLSNYSTGSCIIIAFTAYSYGGGDQMVDQVRIIAQQDMQVLVETPADSMFSACDLTGKPLQVVMENLTTQNVPFSAGDSLTVEVTGAGNFTAKYPLESRTRLESLELDTVYIPVDYVGGGQFNIKVYINSIDSNRANDTAYTSVTLNPDLSIAEVADLGYKSSGDTVYAGMTLVNMGNLTVTSPFEVTAVINGEDTLRESITQVLEPGDTLNYTFSQYFIVPQTSSDQPYYFVEYAHTLSCDADATNNTNNSLGYVNVLDLGLLSVTSPDPSVCQMGGTEASVSVRMYNNGNIDALDSVTIVAEIDSAGVLYKTLTEKVSPLTAGENRVVTFSEKYLVPRLSVNNGRAIYDVRVYIPAVEGDLEISNDTAATEGCVEGGLDVSGIATDKWSLEQNVPNPARNVTVIPFNVPEDAIVTLTVMSANGQMLYTAQVEAEAGNNSYELNVGDLAAGIYYYAMEYKGQRLVRKMNVVK